MRPGPEPGQAQQGPYSSMQWTGKIIGGALGAFLGPVGIAVGAILGHQYDVRAEAQSASGPRLGVGQQFFRATFRVMGHVAKADGRVSEQEIEAARARDGKPAALADPGARGDRPVHAGQAR